MEKQDILLDAARRRYNITGQEKPGYDKTAIESQFAEVSPFDVQAQPGLMQSQGMVTKQPVEQKRDYPKVDMGRNYVPVAKDPVKESVLQRNRIGAMDKSPKRDMFAKESILNRYNIGTMK